MRAVMGKGVLLIISALLVFSGLAFFERAFAAEGEPPVTLNQGESCLIHNDTGGTLVVQTNADQYVNEFNYTIMRGDLDLKEYANNSHITVFELAAGESLHIQCSTVTPVNVWLPFASNSLITGLGTAAKKALATGESCVIRNTTGSQVIVRTNADEYVSEFNYTIMKGDMGLKEHANGSYITVFELAAGESLHIQCSTVTAVNVWLPFASGSLMTPFGKNAVKTLATGESCLIRNTTGSQVIVRTNADEYVSEFNYTIIKADMGLKEYANDSHITVFELAAGESLHIQCSTVTAVNVWLPFASNSLMTGIGKNAVKTLATGESCMVRNTTGSQVVVRTNADEYVNEFNYTLIKADGSIRASGNNSYITMFELAKGESISLQCSSVTPVNVWLPFHCIVTFNSQGGSAVPGRTALYGTAVTAPAPPTRPGYAFAGWYRETASTTAWSFATDKVTGNITLYAKWGIACTVTFNSQGGSPVASRVAPQNSVVDAPAAPARTGYTFAGWYREAACANEWHFATDKVTKNITLYANWTINRYTVAFDSQSGSAVASVMTNYNTTIAAPAPPTRTGYTFAGWYKEAACANEWHFTTDKVTANITLFAKWTPKSYTVTFNSQGGSVVAGKTAKYNTTITAPTPPARAGYIFAGWYREAACKTAWAFATDRVTGNITLYAKWVIACTVTFNSQGGSAVASRVVPQNSVVAPPAAPIRTGYTFTGWYREAACANQWLFATDRVTANITLYAKWTINRYTVAFDSQGGSAVAGVVTNYNTTIAAPAPPTRTGYTFGGWYKEAACANEWHFTTDKVTANITLFAKWTPKSYTVTFNSQGGSVVAGKTAKYNTTITAPAPPARKGYSFVGWYREAGCIHTWNFLTDKVTSNITLFAKWKIAPVAVPASVNAVSASYSSISVTWNAVSGVTGYEIWSAAASSGAFHKIGTTSSAGFTNTGLTTGKTYYYKVRAYLVIDTLVEYSNYSSVSSAKPLLAAPASAKAKPVSYNSIKVTWGAVAGATKYQLYRSTSKSGTYSLVATTGNTYYTNRGVGFGVTYYYKVRAYRVVGNSNVTGGYSNIVSARTSLAAPKSVKAVMASSASIRVSWGSVAGATGYEVWRSSSGSSFSIVKTTSSTSFTDTGIIANESYSYKVRAFRLVGATKVYYSPFSATVSVKT